MYKKSLALLLSILLILTSFISLFSFSASANSVNLIVDGKFENGFSGWEVFNNSGNSSAAFKVVEDGDNQVLSAVSGLSMFKKVELEAGVQYTVSFDFKFDTNATVPATYNSFYRVGFANSVAAIGNSNFVGPYTSGDKYYSVFPNQKTTPNEWKTHTFVFTPSVNMTTYFVVGSYNHQGEANFFLDNVYLAKSTDLLTVSTVSGEGGSVSGDIKTFKGDVVTVKALPSAGYEFDGWYSVSGTLLSNDLDYSFEVNSSIELMAKFKISTYNPNLITNGNFANMSTEGFEVFKNGNNQNENFSFITFGEDYALSAKAGHSLFKKVDLKGGISYTMSFDFRFVTNNVPSMYDSFYRAGFVTSVGALGGSAFVGPNATGNKYYNIYSFQKNNPTNWMNHSFTFTPATDMSVWAVVGSYNHEGVADFELDNWRLYKTSDIITVTALADEGGAVDGTATVLRGENIKLTATAYDGYEFIGWYNGDELISSEAVYTHTATENISLIAKFKSTAPISNYIANGDFEKPFSTDTISNVNVTATKGKWGKIYSGVARMEAIETKDFTENDSVELNGNRYITSGSTKDSNQYIRAFGQYFDLPVGDYVLEFDAKSTASDMFVVSLKKGQMSIDVLTDFVIKYLEQSEGWKHYKITFTADTEGMYQLSFGGNNAGKGNGDFSIDNVSIEAYVEENPNLIVNGDFETTFTTEKISDVSLPATTGKWGKIYSGVARMEAVETKDFTENDSVELNGTRYITSGATKDENQYVRAFGQYVNLSVGEYVLTFDAKATISDFFVASVIKGQDAIVPSDLVYTYLSESADWKNYTARFTVAEDGVYQIAFGGNTQKCGACDFSIDNVGLFSAENYITVTAYTDGGGKVTYPRGNVELGSTATVIATPDLGYAFIGWYKGEEIISADASYSFVVTESVALEAKFELDLGEDAIIKNGKFDINSTAGWNVKTNHSASKAEVIIDPDTGSSVVHTTGNGAMAFLQKITLKANVEYLISFDFKFDNFASIPEEYNSFYRSGFLIDPDKNIENANFIGPNTDPLKNTYVSIASKIITHDKNAWNNISYTFTPTSDIETWFVIGAFNEQGVSNYSFDNVVIIPKKDATGVSVAAISHGGSGEVTSSRVGLVSPGEIVKLTATPNKGSIFGGWYINGNLISNNADYNYEVVGNNLVYARFLNMANPESNQMLDNVDFVVKDLKGWLTNNIDSVNNSVEYKSVNGESYLKLGENDMLYQSVELEPYSTYAIRITTRIPDIREKSYQVHDLGFFRFGISELDKPNVLQNSALQKDPYSYTSSFSARCECKGKSSFHCVEDWNTYTYVYSNNSPDTVLANVVVGAPYCKSDLHIKKFEFVKYIDGIVDFESDILYGENFFNNVKNPSFEEKLSNDNWGSKLPKGWSIKNEGKIGTNYLSISGSESEVYSFKVRTGTTYVVAFSLRSKSSGTSSISIVDDEGNPWGDSFKLVTNVAEFTPKSNGKWQRMGAHLYISDNPEGYANINIKITSGTNVLDIDDITITKLGYATHSENPNVYTADNFNYKNPVWYSPTIFYKLPDGTTVDGDLTPQDNFESDKNDMGSVNTGDDSDSLVVAYWLIIISCILIMAFTVKQTKKEGGNSR